MRCCVAVLLLSGCMLDRTGTRRDDADIPIDGSFDAGMMVADADPVDSGPLPDGAVVDSGFVWPREMPTTCGGPSTLRDLFDDGAIDLAWVDGAHPGASVAETGGRLVLTPPAGATGSASRTSRFAVVMRDDRISVQVEAAPSGETELSVKQSPLDGVAFFQRGSELLMEIQRAGVPDGQAIPYVASDHRFWQIRESAGTVYWETSPDGLDWTERRSVASPSFLDVSWVIVQASNPGRSATPGSAAFDLLNVDRIVAEHCGTSTVSDPFSAATIGTEWLGSPPDSGACTSSQSTGSTRFSMSGAGVSYCERATARAFDLREDYVYIHIPVISSFHPPMSAFLGVRDAERQTASIAFVDDEYVFDILGPADANSYDDSNYWRIRAEGSEIVFDASDDGTSWRELFRASAGSLDVARVAPFFGVATTGSMPGGIGIGVPGYNTP